MIQNSCKNQFYSNNQNQNTEGVVYGPFFSKTLQLDGFWKTRLLQRRQKEEQCATKKSATFLPRVETTNGFPRAISIALDIGAWASFDLAVMGRNQQARREQCKISWRPKILCWRFCRNIPRLVIPSVQDRSSSRQLFSFALWTAFLNRLFFGIHLRGAHFSAVFSDVRYISPFCSSAVSCRLFYRQIFSVTRQIKPDKAQLS